MLLSYNGSIRLDMGLDEKKVRKIYLDAGFKIVDIIDYPNGHSMALYELCITDEEIGKCGYACFTCPTFRNGNCSGCLKEHVTGDCYTRDCVIKMGIEYCGMCTVFPCEAILEQPHTTVLDKEWLKWKHTSNTNR